jgi:hypothetical protein
MTDPDFLPGPAPTIQDGIGRAPGGGTRTYQFQTPGGLYPGIHSMAYAALTDEQCVVRTAPPGGIFCIARRTLVDASLAPNAKTGAKRAVVPPTVGLSDATDGLAYDHYQPTSPWVYWARAAAQLQFGGVNNLRRVNLLTGEQQVVASSNTVYDWTSNLAVLPPVSTLPGTTIVSTMGQEENNPDVNVLLGGVPVYVAPTLVPLVRILS